VRKKESRANVHRRFGSGGSCAYLALRERRKERESGQKKGYQYIQRWSRAEIVWDTESNTAGRRHASGRTMFPQLRGNSARLGRGEVTSSSRYAARRKSPKSAEERRAPTRCDVRKGGVKIARDDSVRFRLWRDAERWRHTHAQIPKRRLPIDDHPRRSDNADIADINKSYLMKRDVPPVYTRIAVSNCVFSLASFSLSRIRFLSLRMQEMLQKRKSDRATLNEARSSSPVSLIGRLFHWS